MKKIFLKEFVAFFLGVMCIGFSSCEKDNLEKTNITSNSDPEGTIVVNLNNDGSFEYEVEIGMGTYLYDGRPYSESTYLIMSSTNNFEVGGRTEIVSVGQVAGLGKVNSIPTLGWSEKTAVVPGCGYVVRYQRDFSDSSSYSPRKMVRYARVYVVDYRTGLSGGIIGAVIKYQENWKNEDED